MAKGFKNLNFGRYEYKYLVPFDIVAEIKEKFSPYVEYDKYAKLRENKIYTVRSIYFDSHTLDFYYEKLDGKKIRRKLRLRTYNEFSEKASFFLEIKRKFSDKIVKERAILPYDYILSVCSSRINPNGHLNNSQMEKKIIEKFIYNLEQKDLQPVILVTYEREAFVSPIDKELRITFDQNVRAICYPKIEDLFKEENLTSLYENYVILELKFNDVMPVWLREIIKTIPVCRRSVSKYCLGIDKTEMNEPLYYRTFFEKSSANSFLNVNRN